MPSEAQHTTKALSWTERSSRTFTMPALASSPLGFCQASRSLSPMEMRFPLGRLSFSVIAMFPGRLLSALEWCRA